MKQKALSIILVLIFIGICIVPTIAQDTKKQSSTSRGNWLYVGGSGPGNYTRIQDAIDDSSDGDTVFVYEGLYSENIVINKSLTLLGETKTSTIIDSQDQKPVWLEHVFYGNISGFTIQCGPVPPSSGISIFSSFCIRIFNNVIINTDYAIDCSDSYDIQIFENEIKDSRISFYESNNILISENIIDNHSSISIQECQTCTINKNQIHSSNISDTIGISIVSSYYCTIENNSIMFHSKGIRISDSVFCFIENNSIISNNHTGIETQDSDHCSIKNNSLINNAVGIDSTDSYACEITSNRISSNTYANIRLYSTFYPMIKYNIVENSEVGISLDFCQFSTLSQNSISNHTNGGLSVTWSFYIHVTSNNFRNNTPDPYNLGYFRDSVLNFNGNYWGRAMILPKVIFGWRTSLIIPREFPVVTVDWHPAKEPYNIPGMR